MRNILRLSCFILLCMVTTVASAWTFTVKSPSTTEKLDEIYEIVLNNPVGEGWLFEWSAVECKMTCPGGNTETFNLSNMNAGTVSGNCGKTLTAPGTYTLKIKENDFHLSVNWAQGEGCESMEFSWTIKGESQGGDDGGDQGGGDQGGQDPDPDPDPEPGPDTSNNGQNIENAIELTINGESKSFKPITIGTDHYIYFKFTPSESCTVQYSITGASVNKVSFSYDGNEFTEIINNEFEVEKRLTYILVECYSSQSGYISLTKKEETPIDPASQIINACTPHYDIENDKLYLVWPEDMDITLDEWFTSAYCEGYTGFIKPILGKNPSNNAKNNCISINFSNGLSEGKHGIIIRYVTFNGTEQAELTIPFEVKVFLINEAEGDADVNNKLAAAIEEGETVNFKSDRTLKADNWNTICLPFEVPVSDFAEVLEVSDIVNTLGNAYQVEFGSIESTATLEAGKPYLVKAKKDNDGKALVYSDVTITVTQPSVKLFDCGGSVCGTFNAMTLNGQYFISKDKFYYANKDVTMKGFRFYITLPSNAEVRSFSIDDNIIETAIDEMEATGANSASVTFDLSGKRVAVKKGIVIENGKKVMY